MPGSSSCYSSRSRQFTSSPRLWFSEISMVQLPGPRKRHAEQVSPPVPAAVVNVVAERCVGDGSMSVHKRFKEEQSSPPLQDMYCGVLDEPMPLGLRLRKSPSLVNLAQMAISRAKSVAGQSDMENSMPEPPIKKATNFPLNFLKIGTWEYASQYEGNLVAKCYYAKHKIVWEILDHGLKSKIEIQWAHISALKAACPEEGDGTLDLVLAQPPLFFKEIDPQPRKHTLWQPTSDITGGQASLHRRHILQCCSKLLSKNFDKLIQCDRRLNQLSQQPFNILDYPIFEPKSFTLEYPNETDAPLPKFTHHVSPCDVSKDGVNDLILQQSEFFAQPGNCMMKQRTAESLDSLLENDSDLANISMSQHNNNEDIFVRKVDSDDLDAELMSCFQTEEFISASDGKVVDCTEPPTILRNDSFEESIARFLRYIEED